MKKLFTLLMVVALAAGLSGCSKDKGGEAGSAGAAGGSDQAWADAKAKNTKEAYAAYASSGGPNADVAKAMAIVLSGEGGDFASLTSAQMDKLQAVIETNRGVIKFKFYPDGAPETVRNFIKLAAKGFYNGLIFHRIVPNFVIQGGDPEGTGTGGPGYQIKAEFNSHQHLPGTVAMARAGDPNSAGSQFYLCLSALPMLDNQYTVFGQLTEGMDVVQAIGSTQTDQSERPLQPQVMTKVTIQPL